MADETRIAIRSDSDMVTARATARSLALELGFSRTDATLIATAISEITRNILVHAGTGEVILEPVNEGHRSGLIVEARDAGPGIRDVQAALGDGYASRGGLGLGLPGARRLMDEFQVISSPEAGTTVRMTKWRLRDELELLRARRARAADAGG
jgi:serine/threonine-protein kinase RsbT